MLGIKVKTSVNFEPEAAHTGHHETIIRNHVQEPVINAFLKLKLLSVKLGNEFWPLFLMWEASAFLCLGFSMCIAKAVIILKVL